MNLFSRFIPFKIECKNTHFFRIRQIFLAIFLLLFDYALFVDTLRCLDLHGIGAGREVAE